MRSKVFAPVAAGVMLAVAGTAIGATRTTTMGISATVAGNCLVTADNLDFGTYDGTAALTGSADVSVRCSTGTLYAIQLNAGTTAGSSFTQRLLANGTDMLQYNLYTTAALNTVWGDGSGTTGTDGGTGTGMSIDKVVDYTVYGELPDSIVNQDAPPGSYTDTITVTVVY